MLPLLLVSFSDQVLAVREAAECAARAMMSKLTGYGVKLILPSLLKVLYLPFLWLFFFFQAVWCLFCIFDIPSEANMLYSKYHACICNHYKCSKLKLFSILF